jgi:ferric-dicitrate binding protein FerR (iron transport regulator)
MDDDWLWDRSGKRDPDVERLERALAPLKYRERPERAVPVARPRFGMRSLAAPVGVVAVLAIAALFVLQYRPPVAPPLVRHVAPLVPRAGPDQPPEPAPSDAAFGVVRVAGVPRIAGAPMEATGELHVGEWLETDADARAHLEVATLGTIEVAEGTRLRLTASGAQRHRLDLARGFISAKVIAPPRVFVVGTPSATAVDLGCAYTLSVDDAGAGLLRVTWGWVALEEGARASFVPAGASCATKPGRGPGTPAFDDAPSPLREALHRFDFEQGGESAARAAMTAARRRDALSVWHLLARVDEALRPEVYKRLTALAPPPPSVTEAAALRLEPAALEAWRDQLLRKETRITW